MSFSFMLLVWPSFTCKLIIWVQAICLGTKLEKKKWLRKRKEKKREICIYPLNQGFVLFWGGKKKSDFDISLLFLLLGFDFELLSSWRFSIAHIAWANLAGNCRTTYLQPLSDTSGVFGVSSTSGYWTIHLGYINKHLYCIVYQPLLVFFYSLSGHIMYIFQHDQFLILG